MVTLTRPAGSLLHQTYAGVGARVRFCYWVANAAPDPITLSKAWSQGGVFLIAPASEVEANILASAQYMWQKLNSAGHKLLVWKNGIQSPQPHLHFDDSSRFQDGVWGNGFLQHDIGTSTSDSALLLLYPMKDAVFSAEVTDSGLRFVSQSDRKPAFGISLRGMPMELEWQRPKDELPSVMELLVTDQSDESGSWRFKIRSTATRDFLRSSPPVIRYMEARAQVPPYPCFDLDAKGSKLEDTPISALVHPYLFEETHTRFEIDDDTALVSQFLDTAGRQVGMLTKGSARFRLLKNPPKTGAAMHMSLAGEFALVFRKTRGGTVKGAGAHVMEVMTGSSGTEFVTFGDGSNELPTRIRFLTDSPAFLPAGKSKLDTTALTAWVVPCGDKTSSYDYVSQPEEAPLFALKEVKNNRNVLTGLQDTPGMEFDPAPIAVNVLDAANAAMPWVPVRSLTGTGFAATRSFEKRVLGQTRRAIAADARVIRHMVRADGVPALRWVVMPQGFSVALDTSNRWMEVVFAVATGDVKASLTLKRPQKDGAYIEQWPVEESLARSATFLVATRFPAGMPKPGGGNEPETPFEVDLEVARWKVGLKIGAAKAAGTLFADPLVLVKLGGTKSVIDLMGATSSWSLPEVFNAVPATAAATLKKSVEGIGSLADGITPLSPGENLRITDQAREAYKTLREKLADPEWNGLVVFNAASSVDNLPEGVAILSGGLSHDAQKQGFWVPCLGVDLAKVNENSGGTGAGVPPQMPAVFAGVHFFDDKDLKTDEPSFGLKLKNLDVVLNNSALKMFVAKAQLRVSTLMGAEAEDTGGTSGRNRLVRIEGSYQGKSAQGQDQYLIKALGEQNISMSGKEVIDHVKVTRLELGSSKVAATATNPAEVRGRIGLWGEIGFGKSVEEATGAKSVSFENLSISMKKIGDKDPAFKFDAGHIAVDWQRPASGPGWLKEFPIKLSGLSWGGADFALPSTSWPKMMELPEYGFTGFDISSLMPNLKIGGGFDFGLEFDIDLGSFGSMTDATKLLRSKVMFGWPGFGRGNPGAFSIGFKFEGGSGPLDIGIQGVLRLRAKKVILRQYAKGKLLGIGLVEPQLDAFGYQIPEDPSKLEMAVVIETGSPNNMPTWVVSMGKGLHAGPVTLDYLAFGQNVKMLNPADIPGIKTATEAVAKAQIWLEDKFKNEDLDLLRPAAPSGKWDLVASGQIESNIAKFQLAFLDDISVYGLHVDAPIQTSWIGLDILYKKIEDDLGVFSIEVDLKGLRNIELGVGSLTLPVFGFEKYSSGDWVFNFGFQGNDFSKAGTFQMLPFLGSASLKLGVLSGRSSQFLLSGADQRLRDRYARLKLQPVYEIQTAFRFGFGKQLQQGILSAGASLTIYGIFQGALGKATAQSAGMQYIKLAGAAGILLEIFGEVNFSVISAAVCIRAWIETGVIVETWEEIAIYAEAGVSIYVRFVVARFRVFGTSIEIAIHFSFSATLRIGTTLPLRIGGSDPNGRVLAMAALAETWPDPLSWVPQKIIAGAGKLTLPIMVSLDAHLDDAARPVISPVLALVNPFPQGMPALPGESVADLVVAGFKWAVRLSVDTHNVDPVSVKLSELKRLLRQMRSPEGASASRWRVKGADGSFNRALDEKEIRDFLASNVQFTLAIAHDVKRKLAGQLRSAQDAQTLADNPMPGISMPWLKEVRLTADAGKRLIRDFTDPQYEVINEAWEAQARSASAKGRPQFDPLDPARNAALAVGALASVPSGKLRSLLDIVLEDWFVAMLEGVIHRAVGIVEGKGVPIVTDPLGVPSDFLMDFRAVVAELLAAPKDGASPAVEVAQHASAVLVHAQRIHDARGWTSLPALAGLDIPFGAGGIENADKSITVQAPKSWNSPPVDLAFDGGIDGGQVFKILQAAAAQAGKAGMTLTVTQARMVRAKDATFMSAMGLAGQDGTKRLGSVFDMPGVLRDLQAREPGTVPVGALDWKFSGVGSQDDKRDLANAPTRQLSAMALPADGMSVGGIFKFKLRRLYSQAPAANPQQSSAALKPSALPGIYGLAGGGESARLVLSSWMEKLSGLAPTSFALFWNPAADGSMPDPLDPAAMHRLVKTGVRFFATNLSTEANPDDGAKARAASANASTIADISDAAAVRDFLWKATLVNSEGFFVRIDTAQSPQLVAQIEALLSKTDSVDFPLAWLRPAFNDGVEGKLHPYESLLFVNQVLPDKSTVVVQVKDRTEPANSVPPGFVKLSVQRDNAMAGVVPAALGDDACQFLSRFAFLEWGIKNSNLVPVQPDESSPAPVDEVPNQSRKLTLAAQEPATFTHTLLLPLSQLAIANRKVDGTLKDSDQRNPYAAIGADIQRDASFNLRDENGHRFPFEVKLQYPEGPIRHLYNDALQRLDAYPGVSLQWSASAGGAICRLKLTLAWSMKLGALRTLSEDRRASFVQQFVRLAWMVRGPQTVVSGQFTVGGKKLSPDKAPKDLAGDIAKFAADVAAKLNKPPVGPDDLVIQANLLSVFEVKPAEFRRVLQSGDAVQLFRVEIVVDRDPSSCDTSLVEGEPAIQRSASAALAAVKENTRAQWASFANAFEAAVKDGNLPAAHLLRLQDGTADQSCWLTSPATLANPLGANRSIKSYAPKPLAKEFVTGQAQLLGPDGVPLATPQTKPVTEVDLDDMAQRSLDTVEAILAPAVAARMCLASPASFDRIVRSKKRIANWFAKQLRPIEKVNAKAECPDVVKKKFSDMALADLRHIYRIGAVCDLVRGDMDGPIPDARVYGSLALVNPKSDAFEFTKLRLPARDAASAPLAVFWKGVRRIASVEGSQLKFTPRYVEVKWSAGTSDIGDYIPSRWFELMSDNATKGKTVPLTGDVKIPMPLRLLPKPAHIYAQESVAGFGMPQTLTQAREWKYLLHSAVPGEEQDKVTFNVYYQTDDGVTAFRAGGRSLFDVLVTFEHYSPVMGDSLSKIHKWNMAGVPDDTIVECVRLANFVEDLADGFEGHVHYEAVEVLGATEVDKLTSSIKQEQAAYGLAGDGRGQVDRIKFRFEAAAIGSAQRMALVELADATSLSKSGLPGDVAPQSQTPIVGPKKDKEGSSTYYAKDAAVTGLAGLSGRRLTLDGLDLFLHATVAPEIFATRNETLGNVEVSDEFVFTTSVSKSTRLVPRLNAKGRIALAGRKTLREHLATMAKELFDGAVQPLSVDAIAKLRIPYVAGQPEGYTYPVGAIKGRSLETGTWADLFSQWSASVQIEITAKSTEAKPDGVAIEISVYADRYAGSRPVLTIKEVWIPWALLVPETPAFGIAPPAVERPQDLAALLYELTRDLSSPQKAVQSSISKVRTQIAALIKAKVPSMNMLATGQLPTVEELRNERLKAAWADCVDVASTARVFGKRGSAQAAFWSLEPVNLGRDGYLASHAWTGVESLKFKASELDVQQVGKTVPVSRPGDAARQEGGLALFVVYSAPPEKPNQ